VILNKKMNFSRYLFQDNVQRSKENILYYSPDFLRSQELEGLRLRRLFSPQASPS